MTLWKRRNYRVGEEIGGGQGLTIKGKYKGPGKDDGTIWRLDCSGGYITNSMHSSTLIAWYTTKTEFYCMFLKLNIKCLF